MNRLLRFLKEIYCSPLCITLKNSGSQPGQACPAGPVRHLSSGFTESLLSHQDINHKESWTLQGLRGPVSYQLCDLVNSLVNRERPFPHL
jgi:hypothetical protein